MRRMQEAIGACRDEIKGAAILWVVFFHAQLGLGGLLYDVQKIGYGGVDMFLFLSGFGLYHSLSRDADAGRYLLRRARRLLPAYLPFCAVWLCVMLPLYDLGTVQSVRVAAGNLLKAETSPFGMALTPVQCIQYVLTRPAVASALVGCKTPEDVKAALAYETASDEEKDYTEVLSHTPKYSLKGKCMYCNHCLPCPSKIDIAQVNKYLDLALLEDTVPDTVKAHYDGMATHASDCIGCGSCEKNCPFSVAVIERMQKAKEVFGQ